MSPVSPAIMPILFVTLIAFAVCAHPRSAAAEAAEPEDRQKIAAHFDTNFGPVSLYFDEITEDVFGSYPEYSGALYGTLTSSGTFDMIWIQRDSNQRCATRKSNSFYWGRVLWALEPPTSPEGKARLIGHWSYCDLAPKLTDPWEGSLVREAGFLDKFDEIHTRLQHALDEGGDSLEDMPLPAPDVQDADLDPFIQASFTTVPPANPTLLKGDLTCDGAEDRFYMALDRQPGPVLKAMLVTYDQTETPGAPSAHHFSFRFDHDRQDGLCYSEGRYEVKASREDFSPGEAAEATGIDEICPIAIKLDDGLCDAARLFWRTGALFEASQERWVMFRQ